MHRNRILLGTLLGAAAIVSIPSAANAATCTYDSTAKTMDVRYRAGETTNTIKPGASLLYSDGNLLRSCFDPATGKAATPTNTAKIVVKGVSGTGPQTQTTILDETTSALADLNRQLDLFVLTGTNDALVLKKGTRNDSMRLSDSLGPEIDLDYNGEADVHMTTSNSVVQVEAGGGRDMIDASSVKFYRTFQFGQDGDDFLFGGAQADLLDGGFGTDSAEITAGGDQRISIENIVPQAADATTDVDQSITEDGLTTCSFIPSSFGSSPKASSRRWDRCSTGMFSGRPTVAAAAGKNPR